MSVLKLYDIFFILLDIYILEQELVVALSRLTNQVMYNWDGLDRVPRDSDLIIILTMPPVDLLYYTTMSQLIDCVSFHGRVFYTEAFLRCSVTWVATFLNFFIFLAF